MLEQQPNKEYTEPEAMEAILRYCFSRKGQPISPHEIRKELFSNIEIETIELIYRKIQEQNNTCADIRIKNDPLTTHT